MFPTLTTRETPDGARPHLDGHLYLGRGKNRYAFRRGNVVVKVPRSTMGYLDNESEARTYANFPEAQADGMTYARCRLLSNGWLVMVYAEPLIRDKPDWADWIECGQVGRTAAGKIVAYDFAG